MKLHSVAILCALALGVAMSCNPFQETGHDFIMRAKIAKLDLIEHNFTLDRETREKKSKEMARELSKEYPAAPPFRKDSTDRIFLAKLPPTVKGIPFDTKKFEYKDPDIDAELLDVFGTQKLKGQKYFTGMAQYLAKGKNADRGTVVIVSDAGHLPEWAVTWMYDKLFKGEGEKFFGNFMPGFEFEKTVDYKGHTWGVWVPGSRLKKYMNKKRDISFFTTEWNSRFLVFQMDVDTAASNLETFHQLVDVQWLDKLRSPDRMKHTLPE